MIKEKPCKGIGKAKCFQGCGKTVLKRQYGLCFDCLREWTRTTTEGQEYALKMIPKAKKQLSKTKKEKTRKEKIEAKSIDLLKLDARRPFQKLIRIRDHRTKCISCGVQLPFSIADYQGGHLFKAELYSGLIFHPDNVHAQCIRCNHMLSGNEAGYINGLIKRIGWARYTKLVSLQESLRSYKWDRYQLIELKKHYKQQLKLVESGDLEINEVDYSPGILKL